MSKKDPSILAIVKYFGCLIHFVLDTKVERFIRLSESYLSKVISGYTLLNEKARKREFDSFIKRCEIIKKVKLPDWLPNAPRKPRLERMAPQKITLVAMIVLSISTLFESLNAGYRFLADMLCASYCTALRKAEPSFSPTIAVSSDSPEILSVLKQLVKSLVRKSRWKEKGGSILRKAIWDYRTTPGELPHHIQDFSRCKCPIPGYKPLKFPMPYIDTIVLVIGATGQQLKEAAQYLANAAVILLNSDAGDLKPTKLPPSELAAYDPAVITQLKAKRKYIAALLNRWRVFKSEKDEDAWARWIVQEARASFGRPDSRYIQVTLDPKKLRDAIRYRVLLDFFDQLETYGILTAEELQPYRQGAKDVFDPAPPETVIPRHAEDPEVFAEIMKDLVSARQDSIVAEGVSFVKKDKPLGAWRTISGERHLVILEDTWAKEYKKAVNRRKDLDASFLKRENWERDLQKLLVEAEMIKAASSGYRYRYDLYGDRTRDTTYVVAIPTQILEN